MNRPYGALNLKLNSGGEKSKMKCKKCENNQFYTKYKDGEKVNLVCGKCGELQELAELKTRRKKFKKESEDIKPGSINLDEQGE